MGYTSQTGKMISTSAKHLLGLLEQQTPPDMAIKNFQKIPRLPPFKIW